MSAGGKDDRARPADLRVSTAERLKVIVEAAERAAERVIDDAEEQARRYLAQARVEADRLGQARAAEVSDLVDALLRQANALREEAERLQAALEDAQGKLDPNARGDRSEPPQDAPPQAEVLTLRAPIEEANPAAEEERPGSAAGARLLATRMAVSGSSREEIEERLRNGFQIEDTTAILDAILGPED
jgi:vacuolar-type H+-ATPase subunit H